jgi:hypothetical protein
VPDLDIIIFLSDFFDSGHLPAIRRSGDGPENQDYILLADSVRKAKALSIISLEIDLGGAFPQHHRFSEVLVALENLWTDAFFDQFEKIAVFKTGPGIRGHPIIIRTRLHNATPFLSGSSTGDLLSIP